MTNNLRGIALEWWKSISLDAKKDYVKNWQNSLEDGYANGRTWPFELISSSSSKVELIYKFLHN